MVETAPDGPAWQQFVTRTAATLGTSAIVAGLVYLVAWNWAGLGRGSKMGLAMGGVLGAAALATALGLEKLPGKLAGAASCGFVGALFVLYTQVYQVGADPWELFAAFAVAAVPYAWATRLPAVGAMAAVSAQLAALLAWHQLHPWERENWGWFSVGWAGVHVPLLLALHPWMPAGAVPRATSVLGIGVPAGLALSAIGNERDVFHTVSAFAMVFIGAHGLRRDLFPLSWAVLAGVAVLSTWIGHEVWDVLREQTWLLLALVVSVLGAGAAAWLRFLHGRSA